MCDQLGATEAMPGVTGERRLRQLEALFLGGPVQGGGQSFSIETLIDILLVLYDECCNSSLRREKTVSDFIEFGKKSLVFFPPYPFPGCITVFFLYLIQYESLGLN